MTRRFGTSRIAVVSFLAVCFFHASNAHAQLEEAMGTNWDNAGRLYKMIVEAFDAGKAEDVYRRTTEFRDNMDYVQNKVERLGQRLHEKDKNGWSWASKRDAVVQKAQQVKVVAGTLGSVAHSDGLAKASSDFRDFKDRWAAFVDVMNGLRLEWFSHGKDLADVLKAFREECAKCMP